MAVKTGDTFVIPIKVEDMSANSLKKIQKAGSKLVSGFDKISASVITLNQGLELLGRAFNQLERAFDSTVNKAIKLEKEVAEITTLLDDSADASAFFTEEILNLQKQFGTTQTDLAKSYYQAISSGAVDAASSTELLVSAQKLAIGGVTELSTSVDGLTTILNAFGLSADRATNVSDALFIGMRAGKTTVGELSASLGQAAALASATGVSFQELIAATSAITTGGVATAEAVTQVRSAIVGLSKQTPQLTDVLNKLGIQNVKAAVESQGLVNVLKSIIGQTDGTTESLTELFGRIEAVNAILALTSDEIGGKFTDIMGDMGRAAENAGEETEKAFQKLAKTTDFRLAQLAGQTEARLTQIGMALKDLFVPILETLVSASDEVFTVITKVSRAFRAVDFKALAGEIDAVVLAFQALAATLTVIFSGQIVTAIKALTVAFKGYAVAAWAAVAPTALLAAKFIAVSAAVLGTVAAFEIIIRNLDRLDELLTSLGGVFVSWGLRLKRTFIGINIAISTSLLGIAETMNKVGVVSDQILSGLRKDAMRMANEMDNLNKEIEEADETLKMASENLDFGFSGEIIEQGIKAIKAFNGELDETTKKAKEATSALEVASAAPQAAQAPEFQLKADDKKALEDFAQRTKEMETALAEAGLSQRELIELRKQAQLAEVMVLEQKLLAQKNLTKEGERQLEQIKAFKEAVEATAAAQMETQGLDGPLGGGVIEDMGNMLTGVMTNVMAAMNPAGIFMAAAEAIVGIIQKVIDFIPKILNAIANIFNSLTDLPNKIFEAISNLLGSIINLVKNLIPNLLNAIGDILFGIVEFFADGLPDAIMSLADSIPEFLQKLIERLPEIAFKFGEALVKMNIGILAVRFIVALIKNLPKLIVAFIKMLPAIYVEFANGIITALKEVINELANAFGFGDIFNIDTSEAEEKLKDLGDKIQRSASELFQVIDLEAAARGLDIADRIRDAINSSVTRAKNIFQQLWAALVKAWEWVRDNILMPIYDAIREAWLWVWNNVIKPAGEFLSNAISSAWNWVRDNILNPFLSGVSAVFTFVKEKLLDPVFQVVNKIFMEFMNGLRSVFGFINHVFSQFISTISSIFNWVRENVIKPLMNIGETLRTFMMRFGQIGQTIWDSLMEAVRKAGNFFKNLGIQMWDGLKAGISTAGNFFVNIGTSIWNGLKKGIEGAGNIFSGVGTKIWETAKAGFAGLGNFVKDILNKVNPANLAERMFRVDYKGKGTVEKALNIDVPWMKFAEGGVVPGSAMVAGDSAMNDRILALLSPGEAVIPRSVMQDPTAAALIAAVMEGDINPVGLFGGTLGKVLKGDLKGAAQDIVGGVGDAAQKIGTGAAVILKPITDIILKPVQELWKTVRNKVINEMVMKAFEGNAFAKGGMVGNGTDTVPAMLTPGEFVVNKDSASANMGLLRQINSSNVPVTQMNGGNMTFNITINATTALTTDQVRKEIVPTMMKEIKRQSQQGRYVISAQGVRA